MNLRHPAILGVLPPVDQLPLFEIVDDHRHIAATLENLETEIALAQRPKMPERFEPPNWLRVSPPSARKICPIRPTTDSLARTSFI